MTATTPLYGLTYPTGTDKASQVPAHIERLARDVEATIAGFGGIANPGSWASLSPLTGAGAASPQRPLGYRKVGNIVELRGRLIAQVGAGVSIFAMPAGFRPTGTCTRIVAANNPASVRVDITAAGAVIVQDATGSGGFISLDGLTYTVD